MKKCVLFALLLASPAVFAQVEFPPEDARPQAGLGALFADGIEFANFSWTDFDGDYLVVEISGTADDFVRRTPNGRDYVHYATNEPIFFSAIVGGLVYVGEGHYQSAYWSNCDNFSTDPPGFSCFIGAGTASMNAHGNVIRQIDSSQCTLTAHLAAFYLDNPSASPGLYVGNDNQFDIKVTCN